MSEGAGRGPLAAGLLVLVAILVSTMGISPGDGTPPEAPVPGAFPMSGTVTFPPGWKGPEVGLLVEAESGGFEMQGDCQDLVVPPLGGGVRFHTWPLLPGYYVLRIGAWTTTVKHARGGPPQDLVLPPLVDGTVRLLDEKSGLPIAGGSVSWGDWSDDSRRTSDSRGEIRFMALAGRALLWVQAPDHVGPDGVFVTFEPGVPFRREFRLSRAAAVHVILRSEGRPADPESVWLRRRSTASGMTVKAGEAKESELKPGPCSIEVKVGEKYERVAERFIELTEGETTTVTVDLVPRTAAGDAARGFGGTVTFHPSWRLSETRVLLWADAMSSSEEVEKFEIHGLVPGRPSPFRFGPLPPGRCLVSVQPQWTASVEVPAPPGGCSLVVPEPGEIRVRIVADEDSTPLRGARLFWHMKAEECFCFNTEEEATEVGTGEFLVQAPPGQLEVRVEAPGRLPFPSEYSRESDQMVPVVSGVTATREIRLPQGGSLRVIPRCGNRRLSAEEVGVLLREPPGRKNPEVTFDGRHPLQEGGAFVLDGIPTGIYPLEIYGLKDRFEDVPDREVVIRAGETTEVAVDLVRRK